MSTKKRAAAAADERPRVRPDPFSAPDKGLDSLSPRHSRTPFVILGMLRWGPASGYALRQRIEQSVGNFWQESFGQLYPSLELLAKHGLVEGAAQARDGRDTKVWSITPEGTKMLARWIEQPPQAQRERNEMLLKLCFAELAPNAVAAHIARIQEEANVRLAELRALRGSVAEQARDQVALPLWLASIDYGIAGQNALVSWCDVAKAALAAVMGSAGCGKTDGPTPRARKRGGKSRQER